MYKKNILFFLFIFITFKISFASSLIDKFEEKLSRYSTFEADIKEVLKTEGFKEEDNFDGKILINKKGEVFLYYTKPEKLFLYINKDGYIYGYSYEDEEGYKRKLSSDYFYLKLFRRFLNKESLKDLFEDIKEYSKDKKYIFVLTPKDREVEKVILETDKNFNILSVKIKTKDGELIYNFSNIKYEKELKDIPLDIKNIIKNIK